MTRTKDEIEKLIVAEEETLKRLENRRPELQEKLNQSLEGYNFASKEKAFFEEAVTKQKNLISGLVNELEGQDDVDFDGCPHEWQRKTISFMRRHPGVPIGILALVTEAKDAIKGEFKIEKAKAAMVSLMSHLIVGKKVEKTKTGVYKWAVYPKDWKTPAPVMRIVQQPEKKSPTSKEEIAEKFVNSIIGGKMYLQRKELEVHFHSEVCHCGLSNVLQFAENAQFIEKWIYDLAQPGGQLAVYKLDEKERQGAELSEHLIVWALGAAPGSPWVRVEKPTARQAVIDTKRKGGSVG